MLDVYLHLFSYGTGNKMFISSLIDIVVRIAILYKFSRLFQLNLLNFKSNS